MLALYKSIDEYTEQKNIMDAKFKQYNKGNKKGYSPDDIVYFCNYHKIKCFGYDWKMQQFITNKNDLSKSYSSAKFNSNKSNRNSFTNASQLTNTPQSVNRLSTGSFNYKSK